MSIEDDIAKSIDRLMTEDANELFGSLLTMVPEENKNLSIKELMKTAQALETPAQAWKRDRAACIKEDREKDRGTLILNAELDGATAMVGIITEKDGVEYRIITNDYLRGATYKNGSAVTGYWLDPLPPLDLATILPLEPLPGTEGTINFTARFMLSSVLSIADVGAEVVDLGPVPTELFDMSKRTGRDQKRSMVEFWRITRADQIARGEEPWSFKKWASRCKAGRAWLERKKR